MKSFKFTIFYDLETKVKVLMIIQWIFFGNRSFFERAACFWKETVVLGTQCMNRIVIEIWLWNFRYLKPDESAQNNLGDEFDFEDDNVPASSSNSGRCRCLEAHLPSDSEDTSNGLLPVERGEELIVIQKDLGSGWTYVQSKRGTGFVPTKLLFFFE